MVRRANLARRLLPYGLTLWAGLALRLLGLRGLPLVPDEAYYWVWSRHLDWSYYDHPAGTALMLRLSTALGGQSEFGLRWLNALLGVACVALVWGIGGLLSTGHEPALSIAAGDTHRPIRGEAAMVVASGAPFLVISRFVYTDTLFLFLMLVNFRCFLRLTRGCTSCTRSGWGSYAAWGVSLALLLNTKYTALLYAAGVGFWLLLRRRRLLRGRRFWIAFLVGAAGFTPILVWNAVHGWTSFGWQLTHLVTPSPGATTSGSLLWMWIANARHAVGYLSWPVVLAALAGGGFLLLERVRRARSPRDTGDQLLIGAVAMAQLLPALLSPASSPRNLSGGLIFLLLGCEAARPSQARCARLLALVGLASVALYGVGSVAALSGITTPFQSSAVREIHRDVAVVTELAATLAAQPPAPVFTVDYGLAGQLSYYMGRPAYASWGQYRVWGFPSFADVTMVSLSYIPLSLIEKYLHDAFEIVAGPYHVPDQPSQGLENPEKVTWWRASGLRWSQAQFLGTFDYFSLAEQTP